MKNYRKKIWMGLIIALLWAPTAAWGQSQIADLSRDFIIEYAKTAVGTSYKTGGDTWDPNNRSYGGVDAAGLVTKCWQVPFLAKYRQTVNHPYSTYHFYNQTNYWYRISANQVQAGDVFVYHDLQGGHAMIFHKFNNFGKAQVFEIGGPGSKVQYVSRDIPSHYVAIRRQKLTSNTSGNTAVAATGMMAVEITASVLNVRSGPSTGYRVVGTVRRGQEYVAMDNSGDWVKIWYGGRTAWVHSSYAQARPHRTLVKINLSSLNVRTGASTGYRKVGTSHFGEHYVYIRSNVHWRQIYFDGTSRWVYTGRGYGTLVSPSNPTLVQGGSTGNTGGSTGNTGGSTGNTGNSGSTGNAPSISDIKNGAIMKRGHNGSSVGEIQRRLTDLGFGVQNTGVYGPTTEGVVKKFQKTFGLSQDGRVGPNTLSRLEEAEHYLTNISNSSFSAWSRGRKLGTIRVIYIDSKPVELGTALSYLKMRDHAARDGVHIKINSGFRSYQHQSQLYQSYLNGTGNLAARPGYSNHQSGAALDLNTINSSVYNWLNQNGWRYKFKRTVPSEKWHWEYRP